MESKQTCDLTNGYYFGDCYVAREVIGHIFSFADVATLSKCRLVCRLWQSIVEDPLLWRKKLLMEGKKWPKVPADPSLPWMFFAEIYRKQPYGRNIITNSCGADKLKSWIIKSEGGDGFAIENPPLGADNLPDEVINNPGFQNSCFATSFHSCSKEQITSIKALGIPEKIMDDYKPVITISEWYAGRFDCSSVYECEVSLMDEKSKVLASYPFRASIKQWEGGAWHKMEKVIDDYPNGVRYIKFYHGGTDTQFWKGHYGSKFTAASLVFELKSEFHVEGN